MPLLEQLLPAFFCVLEAILGAALLRSIEREPNLREPALGARAALSVTLFLHARVSFGPGLDPAQSWGLALGTVVSVIPWLLWAIRRRQEGVESKRGVRPTARAAAGFVVALVFFGALGYSVERFTRLGPGPASADVSSAVWRLRFVPWDGDAQLALAWAALRDDAFAEAEARSILAARSGIREVDRLEFAVEIAAYQGECERARTLFDQALRARILEADPLEQTLELGGFTLQENLVQRCGLLEEGEGEGEGDWDLELMPPPAPAPPPLDPAALDNE